MFVVDERIHLGKHLAIKNEEIIAVKDSYEEYFAWLDTRDDVESISHYYVSGPRI